MRRRRKILVVVLVVAALLLGTAIVLYLLVLPRVVRGRITAALREIGVKQLSFELREVSWRATRISGVSIGGPAWFTADSLEASYSLANLWNQRVGALTIANATWTVESRNGVIDWGPVVPARSSPVGIDMPVDRLELRHCVIRLLRDGVPLSLPLEGSITRLAAGNFDVQIKTAVAGESMMVDAAVSDHGSIVSVAAKGVTDSVPNDTLKATLQWARVPTSLPHEVDVEFARHMLEVSVGGQQLAMDSIGGDFSAKLGEDFLPIGFEGQFTCESANIAGYAAHAIAVNVATAEASIHIGELSVGLGEQMTARDVAITATGPADTPLVEVERQGDGYQAMIHGGIKLASPVSFEGETMRITIDACELESKATIGESGSLVANARIDLGECVLSPFKATSGTVIASMTGPDEIHVQHAAFDLGPHGRFRADPFRFNLGEPRLVMDVACEELSLGTWLTLLSHDEMTGEGSLHGRVEIAVQSGDAERRIAFGRGYLMADPATGWIQVGNAKVVADLLEEQDLGGQNIDATLADVKARIISAFQDLAFTSLHMDFEPAGQEEALQIEIAGKGRQGVEPIEIGSLTVNVNDFDRVFNQAIGLKSGYDRLTD